MQNGKRFVYLLKTVNRPHRPYVGVTSNVARRLEAHNTCLGIYTSRWRPWQLIVAVEFLDEARALSFERYLKSGSGRAFARRHFE